MGNSVIASNVTQCKELKIQRERMSNFRILEWLLYSNVSQAKSGRNGTPDRKNSKLGKSTHIHGACSVSRQKVEGMDAAR